MASRDKTKTYNVMWIELSYGECPEHLVCVAETLDKGASGQPNKEN